MDATTALVVLLVGGLAVVAIIAIITRGGNWRDRWVVPLMPIRPCVACGSPTCDGKCP